jgi:hypothetical protein
MFGWSIYRLFVLDRWWKRDSLQIMIFVYVCATCSVGELKARFEPWKERNEANSVNLFHFSYLITLMAYVCSVWAPNVQINYFILEWSIYIILVLYKWLETWLSTNNDIRICLLDERHSWIKACVKTGIICNYLNCLSLFNLSYLITLMAYLSSQGTPNVQINILCFIGRST